MKARERLQFWIGRIPRVESRAVFISLAVSVGLLTIKFVAYFLTGSAAIFSDAVESIANVMGSSMAFYALTVAHSPADEEHPYGHGKIEFLSAMFEGSLVLLAGVFILVRTIDVMSHGEIVREQQLEWGLWLMTLALVINGVVGLHLIRTGRKQGSMTLEADGKHLMSDALTSIAVLVGLGLVKLTGWSYFDPITAILIGVYIACMALGVLRGAVARLMDEQDPADMQLLRSLLDAHVGPEAAEPRICGYHKLRHRHSGRFHWVDFHIFVPKNWTIDHAHEAAGAIEGEIERKLEEGDATAHVEPCADKGCPHCRKAT
jgi:cation diffusion facilitator family transporter